MKKFDGILMVTDLDGTLLREDKSISEENIKAIEYFKSQGGKFAFVTGRIPVAAKHIYEWVKPNVPCGCSNGGGIYDYSTKKLIWSQELSKDVMDMVEYVDNNLPPMGIEVCTFEKIYFCKKNTSTEKHRINEHFDDLGGHYRDVKDVVSKILFADEVEENIISLTEMLKNHPDAEKYDFVRSDKEYYEILPKGISKGTVLKKLTEILEVDIQKTIAVGDNDNDIEMIKRAKIGIAVENASENAKAVADYVTVSNEGHAIAKIIEDLDKGQINI